MASPPRPILKRAISSSAGLHPHHAVHFPPSPSLTRTFTAHPASIYDRSPIVVAPNTCALPERGCPGRTYTLEEAATPSRCSIRSSPRNGRDLHPRALAFNPNGRALPSVRDHDDDLDDVQRTPTRTMPSLPPLIPDLSSESDESDSFASHPSESFLHSVPPPSYATKSRHGLSIPNPGYDAYTQYDIFNGAPPAALSFLPHPPSPSPHAPREEDAQKPRRRRERRRSRSRSRERRRSVEEEDTVLPPAPRRTGRSGPHKQPTAKTLCSFAFENPDSGCLGGF